MSLTKLTQNLQKSSLKKIQSFSFSLSNERASERERIIQNLTKNTFLLWIRSDLSPAQLSFIIFGQEPGIPGLDTGIPG